MCRSILGFLWGTELLRVPLGALLGFPLFCETLSLHMCLVAQSCLTLCKPVDCSPPGSWGDSPSKNTGVGRLALLQGIFPTQESNQGPLPCRWILYQLSYQLSDRRSPISAYTFRLNAAEIRNDMHTFHLLFRYQNSLLVYISSTVVLVFFKPIITLLIWNETIFLFSSK